jgi:DNA-binding CsgD family transcriptional regulator
MATEAQSNWEALLAGLNPDRCSREILFDPMVEDWAFAGLSDGYREQIRQKNHSDQERAVLLDRLRWVVQKRLKGREQESMLLFLAGCTQVQIADRLAISRSTVRRILAEAGDRLQKIVTGTNAFQEGSSRGDVRIRIVPLDTEDDYHDFEKLVSNHEVSHIALGTFADLREALVVFREAG